MKNIRSNTRGFGLAGSLTVIVILAIAGFGGWFIHRHNHNAKKVAAASKVAGKAPDSTTNTTTDPYAGWKTYTSLAGEFSFKYPVSNWTLDGFQGETPVNGSMMNGSETQIRLFEANSTYSIIMNIGSINQANLGNTYSNGSTSTLGNGLQVWQTNADAVTNPQCFSGVPIDLALVYGSNFYKRLSSGQYLSYVASFCYGQKDATSLTYQQQIGSPEAVIAKKVLASFSFLQ